MLDRSWNDGGLLIFSEKESKQINASMEKGMTEMQNFTCVPHINLKWDMISPFPGMQFVRES
jgi:hypothetical protein